MVAMRALAQIFGKEIAAMRFVVTDFIMEMDFGIILTQMNVMMVHKCQEMAVILYAEWKEAGFVVVALQEYPMYVLQCVETGELKEQSIVMMAMLFQAMAVVLYATLNQVWCAQVVVIIVGMIARKYVEMVEMLATLDVMMVI